MTRTIGSIVAGLLAASALGATLEAAQTTDPARQRPKHSTATHAAARATHKAAPAHTTGSAHHKAAARTAAATHRKSTASHRKTTAAHRQAKGRAHAARGVQQTPNANAPARR